MARHTGAKNNIWRKNKAKGGIGILIRDGAIENFFEGITMEDCYNARSLLYSGVDKRNKSRIAAIGTE